jgi:hypothetical protein
MASILTSASFTVNCAWQYDKTLDLTTVDDTLSSLAIAAATLTNGPGLNQGDQLFHDRRTLATTATETIDMFDFAISAGAAQLDSLGNALAMDRVKVFLFFNRSTTAGETFTIFGEGTGAAWNSPLNGSDTAKAIVGPGGVLLLTNPSAAGMAVADTTNHLFKVENTGAGSNDYDIIVVGANA